jgi:hypothetical protein
MCHKSEEEPEREGEGVPKYGSKEKSYRETGGDRMNEFFQRKRASKKR